MKSIKRIAICLLVIIFILLISIVIFIKISSQGKCYKNEAKLNIPIFIYHDIVENNSDIKVNYMQTKYSVFKNQILGLIKLGYVPITYDDLIDYYKGEKSIPRRSILITFDDGFSGVYDYAYKFAKEYNIPITSFLINYNVGTKGYYTWDQAKEMSESGIVKIYSHSMQHLKYDQEDSKKLLDDVNNSLAQISDKLNVSYKNKIFTYPYGLHTKEEQELLKQNEIVQNLTDAKINTSDNLDIYGLHRMYPLSDSPLELYFKIDYRAMVYKD